MEKATVLIGEPHTGERLGKAMLLAATDDLTVMEYALVPGSEPGNPHYHVYHTDSFYVLEGELEFQIEGRAVRARAGTLIVAPRGAVHAFSIARGGRARFLNIHAPGGFEYYMRALIAMRARGEQPDAGFLWSHDNIEV